MGPVIEEFLADNDELLAACATVDVALLMRKAGDARTVIDARLTAGNPLTLQPDQRLDLGDWEACRFRLAISTFRTSLLRAEDNQGFEFPGYPLLPFAESPTGWYRNDSTPSHDPVFGVGAHYTWLNATVGRVFPNLVEFNCFLKTIQRSHELHDVTTLGKEFRIRSPMSADSTGGVRFEIEMPVYYTRADWRDDEVTLRFDVRPPLRANDVRVKWRSSEHRDTATLSSEGGESVARLMVPSGQIDATVQFLSTAWNLSETRPRPALSEFFPDPPSDGPELAESSKLNFERFGTKRQTLRRAIKKQVKGDEEAFTIVARDIEDALWCLQEGRYKIAAILVGGIVEGILLSRLDSETRDDLRAAFVAVFPGKTPIKNSTADMRLQELIGVAAKLKRLKHDKLYDLLRDWRNFVHFDVEKRHDPVDINSAEIAVRAAIMLLLEKT